MGTYLNPGNWDFDISVHSNIYVDKTDMVQELNSLVNTSMRYIAVSRPRRFGKTTTANMIAAYYDRTADSRSLFAGRKLSKCAGWDQYLGKFNVIRVTMTEFIKNDVPVRKSLSRLEERILDELAASYPEVSYDPDDFFYSMDVFYRQSGIQFVIVIDEWDSIFREKKNDKEGQDLYLKEL